MFVTRASTLVISAVKDKMGSGRFDLPWVLVLDIARSTGKTAQEMSTTVSLALRRQEGVGGGRYKTGSHQPRLLSFRA